MIVHLCTFSDESMSRSRELCASSAERHGCHTAITWSAEKFRSLEFFRWNKQILRQPRGCGYWAWKPYIVADMFAWLSGFGKGDIIVYADAGVEFINNVSHIIDRMDQDIFLFGNNWEHAHWCKRDIIEAVWPYTITSKPESISDNPSPWGPEYQRTDWDAFGKQCQASVIFFRVSDYSRQFVAEWLKWCLFEGGRLIDDSPSRAPNHPEFRENRHDQAILTTMAYREGIKLHYWPAVYNRGSSPEFVYEKLLEYAGDNYPVLFSHHRKRNHEWVCVT